MSRAKNFIRLFFILIFLISSQIMNAQVREDPEWILSISDSLETGQEATIVMEASVPKDWYMYSSDFDPELGPMVTKVLFEKNSSFELIGGLKPIGEKEKYDSLWDGEYTYFTKKAVFEQQIKVKDLPLRIKATATYQICSDVTGQCIPYETSLTNPQEVKYQSNSFNN